MNPEFNNMQESVAITNKQANVGKLLNLSKKIY